MARQRIYKAIEQMPPGSMMCDTASGPRLQALTEALRLGKG